MRPLKREKLKSFPLKIKANQTMYSKVVQNLFINLFKRD